MMATYQEQIERNRLKAEMRKRKDAEDAAKKLSPEQIKNWRQTLFYMVGPYAFVMPDEMVQQVKDRFADGLAKELSQSAAPSPATSDNEPK